MRGILSKLLSCQVFSWLHFTNVSKNVSLLCVNVLRKSVIEILFPVPGRMTHTSLCYFRYNKQDGKPGLEEPDLTNS